MALGRRARVVSRIPRSAAWASRKRKSIDWDFSALRAMVEVLWEVYCGARKEGGEVVVVVE